ncbi:MAG: N-acyl homoserine lactonase family protein [Pseudomonadota bacterium]
MKGLAALSVASAVPLMGTSAFELSAAESAEKPTYKIFNLKYAGPFTSSKAMLVYMTGWEEKAQRNYYFWVIQGEGKTVVFDCGVRPQLAIERNLAGYVSPEEMLSRIGVEADEVEHLVLSHCHFDHIGGIAMFPKAKVYVQRSEFDFWVYDQIAERRPFAMVADPVAIRQLGDLKGNNRLVLIGGDVEILPGVELLLTPGHTPGLQSMVVNTEKGAVILASDCAHVQESFSMDMPSGLITDMPAWLSSYSKLKNRVNGDLSLLYPGHDVTLLENFPKFAKDVSRLA